MRRRLAFLAELRSEHKEELLVDLFALMQPITFCNLLLVASADEPATRCVEPADDRVRALALALAIEWCGKTLVLES